MAVPQTVLSTIMLANVKLSYENVKLQLAKPEIYQARNVCCNPCRRYLNFCSKCGIIFFHQAKKFTFIYLLDIIKKSHRLQGPPRKLWKNQVEVALISRTKQRCLQ